MSARLSAPASARLLVCICAFAGLLIGAQTQSYDTNNAVVQTFAGSGSLFGGYLDGQRTQAQFNSPSAMVADSSNNLFVLDSGNRRIRKITPDGTVSTFVGGGNNLRTDPWLGYGTNVALPPNLFGSMAIDRSNTIWIVNTFLGGFLRVGSDSSVMQLPYSNEERLNVRAGGVCVDSASNLYFSEPAENKIYRLGTNGALTLFADSFIDPRALAADAADNIYVWDNGDGLVSKIDQDRNVTTIAGNGLRSDRDGVGTNASFSGIGAMTVDDFGNIFLACGRSIRRISASTKVTTIAGTFYSAGYVDGPGAAARFGGAGGICLLQQTIFVTDGGSDRIRQITFIPLSSPNLSVNISPNPFYVNRKSARLTVTGILGRWYEIQSSTNMSNWTPVANISMLESSSVPWIDPDPIPWDGPTGREGLKQEKFYRAYLLP